MIMKTKTYELSMASQGCFVVMLTVLLMMIPDIAHAYYVGYSTAMGYSICVAARMFFGNAGKGLCTIGLCVLGVGALLGKVSWGLALIVGVGCAIIFGSVSLVYALVGIDPSIGCIV
jgi:type IV secretory pathway VirB2 component (pilin)